MLKSIEYGMTGKNFSEDTVMNVVAWVYSSLDFSFKES